MTEEVITEQQTETPAEAPETPPEQVEFEAAKAIWDKQHEEPEVVDERPRDDKGRFVSEAPEEAPEAPVEAEADPEPAADTVETVDVPGHLPEAVKAVWTTLPDEAKEAVSKSFNMITVDNFKI